MPGSIADVLHPRLIEHCVPRFRDGYYKDAAREAMTQVELAIKDRVGLGPRERTKVFGVQLCTKALGPGSGIKLCVPFGPHMQEAAQKYFEATFAYYRNYAHHEGDKIDAQGCLRILVVASDLLYLVGASRVSFAAIGGIDGLVTSGVFRDKAAILELLSFLDGYCLPDQVCDGLYETVLERGFEQKHVDALVDCGLVEYMVSTNVDDPDGLVDEVGIFHLTPQGAGILGRGAS